VNTYWCASVKRALYAKSKLHSKIDFITLFASKNPRIETNSETSKKTPEITLLERDFKI
jgi:hypothetical protein